MIFGKAVHKAIEDNDTTFPNLSLHKIERYALHEHQVEVEIGGVPVKAYIDTFDLEFRMFRDYKTGLTRWSQGKVNNWQQLPFYSMLLEHKYGTVQDLCFIDWIETEKHYEIREVMGHTIAATKDTPRLTGVVESFSRFITIAERKAMVSYTVQTAQAISEDWAQCGFPIPQPEALAPVVEVE